jgi:hypothetical protein
MRVFGPRQIITLLGVLPVFVSWTMGSYCTEGDASVGGTAVSRQAEEVVRRELQPGEYVASSAEVTSDPSRWAVAAFPALAIAVVAAGLVSLFGSLPGSPAGGFAGFLLPLSILFLPRPMFVVVTSQRLICLRLSRFRRAPRQRAFAGQLAEVRIVKYRPGKYASDKRRGVGIVIAVGLRDCFAVFCH